MWPRWSCTERISTLGSRCGLETWKQKLCSGTDGREGGGGRGGGQLDPKAQRLECLSSYPPCPTHRSPRSLVCVVPDVAAFGSDWRWLRTPITVPVSLLRADALFYPSAFSFTYTPEYSARPRPPDAHEPAPDADALLESIHHEFTRTNFHLFCPS